METKFKEYIEKIEKEIKELGVNEVVFKDGVRSRITGKNVLNPYKADKATILAAKLDGFKDALRILEKEKTIISQT